MQKTTFIFVLLLLLALPFAQAFISYDDTSKLTSQKIGTARYQTKDQNGYTIAEDTTKNKVSTNAMLDCGFWTCDYNVELYFQKDTEITKDFITGYIKAGKDYVYVDKTFFKQYNTIPHEYTTEYIDNKSGETVKTTTRYDTTELIENESLVGLKQPADSTLDVVIRFRKTNPYSNVDIAYQILNSPRLDFGWWNGSGGIKTTYINGSGTNITVHTFLTNGSFNYTGDTTINLTVLVLAGGGAGGMGGNSEGAGGGGAGGLIYWSNNYTITPGTNITVIVGNGGLNNTNANVNGNNGTNSTFGTITAMGGGGGTSGGNTAPNNTQSGGSGGGGNALNAVTGNFGIPGQGSYGGNGSNAGISAGGGGGAGYRGASGSGAVGGVGGIGLVYSINGSSVTYACGGGGASWTAAGGWSAGGCSHAGTGGWVNRFPQNGTNAEANFGSGGGGGVNTGFGGNGSSGIVIVSYPTYILNLSTLTTITYNSPITGNTFLNNSVVLNFTANDSSLATVNCSFNNDSGTWASVFSVAGNSSYQTTLSGFTEGSHNINVTCNGSVMGVNSSVSFTLVFTNVTTTTYNSIVNETSNQTFNITINSIPTVNITGANLTYSGAVRTATLISNSSTQYNYSVSFNVPLIETNNTNKTFNWTYAYVNGGAHINYSSTASQTVYWAYYMNSTTANSGVIEGDPIPVNATIGSAGIASTSVFAYFNSAYTNLANTSATFWTGNLIAPTIAGSAATNANYIANFSLNVTYNGTTYQRNYSAGTTFTDYNMIMFPCNGTGLTTINFTFYEQAGLTPINATMQITGTLTNPINTSYTRPFSASLLTASSNYTICIYPNFGNGSFTTTLLSVSAFGYNTQTFTIAGLALSNSSINYSLYLSNSSYKLTFLNLQDGIGNMLPNYLIKSYQYYPSTGTYAMIGSSYTDSIGQTTIYAQPNSVYYYFTIEYPAGTQIMTFNNTFINCDPAATSCSKTLITQGDYVNHEYTFVTQQTNDTGCVYYNTTYTVSCFANNPTGTWSNLHLQVWQFNGTVMNLVCDNITAVLPGFANCTLADHYGSYYYTAKIATGSPEGMFISMFLNLVPVKAQFQMGMLGALALVVIGGGMGIMFGFAPAIIMAAVGFLLSVLLGFIYVDWVTVGGIIVMAVVAAAVLKR